MNPFVFFFYSGGEKNQEKSMKSVQVLTSLTKKWPEPKNYEQWFQQWQACAAWTVASAVFLLTQPLSSGARQTTSAPSYHLHHRENFPANAISFASALLRLYSSTWCVWGFEKKKPFPKILYILASLEGRARGSRRSVELLEEEMLMEKNFEGIIWGLVILPNGRFTDCFYTQTGQLFLLDTEKIIKADQCIVSFSAIYLSDYICSKY